MATDTAEANPDVVATAAKGDSADKNGDTAKEPAAKKAKLDDGGAAAAAAEERDFDEETQKALEEIDANQNEIDALNERKFICQSFITLETVRRLILIIISRHVPYPAYSD